MTGKTHITTSLLCGSFIFRSNPLNIIYIPFLVLGALISDVDAEYSKVQTITYKIFYTLLGIFIVSRNRSYLTVVAIILFITVSILAKKYTKHRTFTHSLLGLLSYSICILFISRLGVVYFAIGYISHLLLDSLTKKGIMLLYPCDRIFKIEKFWIDETSDYTIRVMSFLLTLYVLFIP